MAILFVFLDIESFQLIALTIGHDFSQISLLLVRECAATAFTFDWFSFDKVIVDLIVEPGVLISDSGDALVVRHPVLLCCMARFGSFEHHVFARPGYVRSLRGQMLQIIGLIWLITCLQCREDSIALSLHSRAFVQLWVLFLHSLDLLGWSIHLLTFHHTDVATRNGWRASLRANHGPAEEKHGLLFVFLQLVASCRYVAHYVWRSW